MIDQGWKPPFYEWTIRKEFSKNPETGENKFPFPDISTGIETTVETITKELKENGPYDIIWGFSQGTIIIRYLDRIFKDIDPETFKDYQQWYPKFAIMGQAVYPTIMKFKYKDVVYDQLSYKHSFDSLHFMSDQDEFMKENNTLGLFTYSPPIVKHNDGHEIPKKLDADNFKIFNDYLKKVY